MSRATWRLLFDIRPAWLAIAALVLGAGTLMDALAVADTGSGAAPVWMAALWAFLPSIPYLGRFPVWRLLPVSSLDRRRAQWWAALGLPLACILLPMGCGLAAAATLGGLRAGPPAILDELSAQVTAVVFIAAVGAAVSAVSRRLPLAGRLALSGVFLAAAFSTTLLRSAGAGVVVGGGLALLLAGCAYAFADRLGELLERRRSAADVPSRPAKPQPALRGWLALAPYALGAVVLSAAAAVATNYSLPMMFAGEATPAGHGRPATPILVTILLIVAIAGSLVDRAVRVLRLLPLRAGALALALQAFLMALAAAALAAVWAVFSLTGGDTTRLPLWFGAAAAALALYLPLQLRFGSRWSFTLYIGLVVAWTPLGLAAAGPGVMVAETAAVVLCWAWTWWELARGRAAYRPRPAGRALWRGRPA